MGSTAVGGRAEKCTRAAGGTLAQAAAIWQRLRKDLSVAKSAGNTLHLQLWAYLVFVEQFVAGLRNFETPRCISELSGRRTGRLSSFTQRTTRILASQRCGRRRNCL